MGKGQKMQEANQLLSLIAALAFHSWQRILDLLCQSVSFNLVHVEVNHRIHKTQLL